MDNQAKLKRGPINKSPFEFIAYINLLYPFYALNFIPALCFSL